MQNAATSILRKLQESWTFPSKIVSFVSGNQFTGKVFFRIRTTPKWLKIAISFGVIALPLSTMSGLFLVSDSVAFSFDNATCVHKPSLFPGVNSVSSGKTFHLEQVPSASFGSTPIFSNKTCVYMHAQPEQSVSEQISIRTPIGLATTVIVEAKSVPELVETDLIDPNISGKSGMSFSLNIVDSTFGYELQIANQSLTCSVDGTSVWCPFGDTQFNQGAQYPFMIKRLLPGTDPIEIYAATAQTAEPLTLAVDSIQPDQTIVTHIQELTITANKAVQSVDDVSLETSTGEPIPLQTTIQDSKIIIKTEAPLPRSTSFKLQISSAQAADEGYLVSPLLLSFHTSGGPKVISANIAKTGVALGIAFVITTDIDLSSDQNIASLISLQSQGNSLQTSVSIRKNTIIVTPSSLLPKCRDFTLSLASGSVSIHGVGDGQAWSYTARSLCRETSTIGSSVAGRSIVAYKFGSGARTIMFVGGLHGSEKSSVRTLDSWVNDLESNYQRIPSDKTIIVVPNLNPDGYATGARTNVRGVDLNRNFPSNDWSTDVYQPGNVLMSGGGGPTPLSEPETSTIALYIQAMNPEAVLTYHAVARSVIYNGSGNSSALASIYGQKSGFSVSSSTQEDGIFNYPTTGELETWLHDDLGIATLLIENATMSGNEFSSQSSALWAIVTN